MPEAVAEKPTPKEVIGKGALDIVGVTKRFIEENDVEPIIPVGGLPGKDGAHIGCDYAYYLWGPREEGKPARLVGVLAGHFVQGEWKKALDNASFIPSEEIDIDKMLGR